VRMIPVGVAVSILTCRIEPACSRGGTDVENRARLTFPTSLAMRAQVRAGGTPPSPAGRMPAATFGSDRPHHAGQTWLLIYLHLQVALLALLAHTGSLRPRCRGSIDLSTASSARLARAMTSRASIHLHGVR